MTKLKIKVFTNSLKWYEMTWVQNGLVWFGLISVLRPFMTWVRNDQSGFANKTLSRYEMIKLGTKGPNWVRNDQIENKSVYEFNKKIVRTELGTK